MVLFQEALRLKSLHRAGWLRKGISGPESVAAHSWGVAWLVVALLPKDMDRAKALTYAILHDLPECKVGDITPEDGISASTKHELERHALKAMAHGAPWFEVWEAYERQADPESRFVRELDRLDMAFQAVYYAREGYPGMAEFVQSAAQVVQHPVLRPLLEQCAQELQLAV